MATAATEPAPAGRGAVGKSAGASRAGLCFAFSSFYERSCLDSKRTSRQRARRPATPTDVDTVFCILRIQFGGLLAFRYGLAPGVAWHICSPIITQKVISRDMGKIGRGAFHGLVYGRARAGATVTVALGGMSLAGDKP